MNAIKKPTQRLIPPPGRKLTPFEAKERLHNKFGKALAKLAK
ncbi:MAG: hypothetical protein JWO31_1010 [Phycisphaerales bacterium]|nr:hypothetical protein [Phycisphaerales bacterium]